MICRLLPVCLLFIAPLVGLAEDAAPAAGSKTVLGVGAVAPEFAPEKWLKGEAVTSFDPKKVYLVECWATWCGPCVAVIPHINDLHLKFKDRGLVVIGANVMENDEAKAAAFVTRKGDKMAYRVAFDGKSGQIAKKWLEAANINGIPHSFLVRDGKIVWHGHPSGLTEASIQQVLDGGSPAPAKAGPGGKPDEKLMAYRRARIEVLGLLQNKDGDQALAKITEQEKILGGSDPSDPDLLRAMAYSVKGEQEPAMVHYRMAVEAAKGDAGRLFRVALGLMDYGSVRDHDLALQCARGAVKAEPTVPLFKHMQARAECASGNKDEAVRIMERLVDEEDNDTWRDELRVLKETGRFPESNVGKGGR